MLFCSNESFIKFPNALSGLILLDLKSCFWLSILLFLVARSISVLYLTCANTALRLIILDTHKKCVS